MVTSPMPPKVKECRAILVREGLKKLRAFRAKAKSAHLVTRGIL
jgi:hypothetical protein